MDTVDNFEATRSHVVLFLYGHRNAHYMLGEVKVYYKIIHKNMLENLQRLFKNI